MQLINVVRREHIYANTGGPMSRTRKQQIASSLLGQSSGHHVHCPLFRTLGLQFEDGSSAVSAIEALMQSIGMDSLTALRGKFELPDFPMMARPADDNAARVCMVTGDPMKVLEQALWLGLCSPFLFDPSRPLVWTETSLRRRIELFEPAGFYL